MIMRLLLMAALATSSGATLAQAQAKVCSTLGKVHAQRDQQLFEVRFQSINGRLSPRRADACITLAEGQYVLGIIADTAAGAFPKRRQARGALREQQLPLTVEAGRTYTIAAQLNDRFQASWIPIVQRVELWDRSAAPKGAAGR